MHYLTIEERERLAYAEGYTETAAVLGQIDDLQRALGEEAAMQAQIDDLATERDGLKDELKSLFTDYKNARRDMDEAHDKARSMETAARMALDLLEDPDADAFRADAVAAYLRQVLA
jgi:DNA repair exonuclease SbcCD ATPase subunit